MEVNNQTKPVSRQVARKFAGSLKQMVISLSIIALGILLTIILIKSRRPPQQKEQEILAPLVMVKQLKAKDIQMVIRAYGTVSPNVEVDIVPEVSGKPRDYEFTVQQTNAVVADALVRLEIEMAEAEVARREWEQLHPGTEPNSPLVLRESQVRQAQAALESAKAQLATAQLRLERTSLSLPFDALIISEKVDLGRYMVAGQG
ncbi:MAG: efflux RND transporter periplasmic adaptor subunit [Planctomycetota bacterium]|jgi:multidrug efflux pump subunit AcrA (membrane-fusion protein)